jgi:hypothetical protein
MQGPALDGFAEHDVAGADRKSRPDEVAHKVADPIVARIFPPELEHLVDAAEDGLSAFGGGSGIRIGFPQAFQEVDHAGFTAGENLKAGAAGGVPLFVGQALEVWGPSEGSDGAEEFARADGDVQRQPVEEVRTGVRRLWSLVEPRSSVAERILRTFFRDLFGPSIVAAFQRQFVFREGHRDAHEFGCDVFVEKPFYTILHVVADPSSELEGASERKAAVMRTAARHGPPGRQTEFNFDFVHDHFNVGHSRLRAPASALSSKEAKDDCEFQTGFRLIFGIELPQVLSIVLQVIELGQALGEDAQGHSFRTSAHNRHPSINPRCAGC